jgi:polyvinyl alcohol dehydrogenase (cytochrome)
MKRSRVGNVCEVGTTARARRWVFDIGLGLALGLLPAQLPAQGLFDWPTFGQNPANSGSNLIGPSVSDAKNLKLKWTFTAGGEISARASVANGVAYFPDWGGNIWAVNANTGAKIWGHKLTD